MATIAKTVTVYENDSFVVVEWQNLGDADVGEAFQLAKYGDRSVQINGAFGSATVTIKGSNDGTNYVTLYDASNTAISTTSATRPLTIVDLPRYIRPETTGGTGTAVDVYLMARRTN